MRQFIILTDDEVNAIKNNELVRAPVDTPDGPIHVYLCTRKGYELDIEYDIDKAEKAGHSCDNCKHTDKGICDEPCSSCDIRLGNNKWEPDIMKNCSECLNSRLIVSENGWHPVCTLPKKEARECLIDGSKYLPNELYLKCGGDKS